MRFLITIDTEGDNQWDHGRDLTVQNLKYVSRFQNLCNKYRIKPTYLITTEVCEDPYAKEIMSDFIMTGKAEIGAHLHSWTTPPFIDKDGYRLNDANHAFATELTEDLLIKKIRNLTNQIESTFGKRPLSFRSGRYGFNENVARILADNSYLVDSSVTPYTSWSHCKGMPGGKGGPDFMGNTAFPFKYNFAENSLLEIPVTILPTRFPLNQNKKIADYYFSKVDNSIFLRLFRKLLYQNQPLWLRPFRSTNISAFEELLNEAFKIRLPYIVMMFHSSELMPGCSKYRTDENEVEELYNLLELFFQKLQERKLTSVTLTEAAENYNL